MATRPAHPEIDPSPGDRAGSEPSVEALFRQHADTVARWVGELGGPSVDLEDAVQEVFVVVHRRLAKFRGEARITTWLFRITYRVVQHHRRRQRWRRWIGGSAEDVAGGAVATGRSPGEAYEHREAVLRLYRTLDRMDHRYRTVLVLAKLEGLSGDEIATLIGTKPVTVRVWLHRAMAQFRQLAEKEAAR